VACKVQQWALKHCTAPFVVQAVLQDSWPGAEGNAVVRSEEQVEAAFDVPAVAGEELCTPCMNSGSCRSKYEADMPWANFKALIHVEGGLV
jgi:hypothetical protein